MEFHQIRYFLAACDHMNFTRAAEACSVSQPALTVAIRKLEDELGGPLFHRDSRGIALTKLGAAMRTQLAQIEETRRIARRTADAMLSDGPVQLDVGVYSTVGPALLRPLFEAFYSRASQVELVLYDVWGRRAFDLLISGAFECAIVSRHTPLPDRVTAIPLLKEPMVLGVATDHPFAGRDGIHVSEIAEFDYFDRLRCEFREPILEVLGREGVAPRVPMRSESDDWILSTIASGTGTTIGPRSVLSGDGIATLPVDGLHFERQIELVTVSGRELSPSAHCFVDHLASFEWPDSDPG